MAAEVAGADTVPSHGAVHDYSYAREGFPVNGQEPMNAFGPKPRTSHDSFATYSRSTHKQNHGNAVTGKPSSRNSSRSRTRSRQDSAAQDQNYLLPNRADALGKREKSLSRTGSEADSLLDLYGRESANRSATSVMESIEASRADKKQPQHGGFSSENAYWIHRDKLAKIESEELQQLGVHLPPSALSGGSKHSRGRTRSRDSHSQATNGSVDHTDHQWPATGEERRQWVPSSSPIEGTEEQEEDGPTAFDDPRLPEEIAADPYEDGGSSAVYRMPVLRKSNSKIPVLSSTRLPLPQDAVDRPTPSTRSRNNTVNSGDAKPRSRQASESAAHIDETPEPTPPAAAQETKTTPPRQNNSRPPSDSTPSQPASPVKTPGKPASATRKTSAPPTSRRPTAGSRTKSSPNGNTPPSNQRPTTRSGDRPSTAVNRPEGDPPWLATMYKPDPRLPPDQQMLPTHARKIAEEQWEREGPAGSDKDSSPLAGRGDKANTQNSNLDKSNGSPAQELRPFAPERKLTPDPNNNRPGTSGTDRVYKTIPTIQPTTSATSRPRPMEVQEPPPAKEKSCGCCTVM